MPQPIQFHPLSIPTYLQLELSSARPSPLYIYRTAASEFPYESSKVKFERLLNFLILPPQLEQVLYFGSLACLDAWLHTFTILPLRFFQSGLDLNSMVGPCPCEGSTLHIRIYLSRFGKDVAPTTWTARKRRFYVTVPKCVTSESTLCIDNNIISISSRNYP